MMSRKYSVLDDQIIKAIQAGQSTFGRDLEAMRTAGLTFAEAITGTHFGPMPRFRLTRVRDDLYARLDRVRLGSVGVAA